MKKNITKKPVCQRRFIALEINVKSQLNLNLILVLIDDDDEGCIFEEDNPM